MRHYDNLEFRHLKYLVAIAEEGTFTAAAQRIPVAQSALSKQIREIEDAYEIRIFSRDRDGYRDGSRITPAGEVLLSFARRMLDLRMDVIHAVQATHQGALQPLRLGFSSFVDKHLLGHIVQAHKIILPTGVLIPECGDTEDLLRKLCTNELDAALVTLPVGNKPLHIQEIQRENLVVCLRADDPLADLDSIPPTALNGVLSVFSDPRHHPLAHLRLVEMLREVGIQSRPSNPNFNFEQIQWMVKERHCYALVAETSRLQRELTTRPIKGVAWTIDSAFVYPRTGNAPAVSLLARELEHLFRSQAGTNPKKPSRTESMRPTVQGQLKLVGLDADSDNRSQRK